MRLASATRPCWISQRGLSGMPRRRTHTNSAPADPVTTTQRQPSKPRGAVGTSLYDRKATIGTAENWITWLKAKARPRTCLGTSSAM